MIFLGKDGKGGAFLDLSVKSRENLDYMVTSIYEKLKMINIDTVMRTPYSKEHYDKIYQIYRYVSGRTSFSPSEMQAIAEELGSLRKE